MGQGFCLIAPRLRERLGWSGKLGEILFDGSAFGLVTLFARPVVTPSEVENANDEPKNQNQPLAAQEKVIPRKRRRQSSSSYVPPSNSHAPPQQNITQSRLLQLPTEIRHIIFESLDIIDIFLLGLTCQSLWATVKPMIRQYFGACLGSWAGTPIICVGDGCECGENVYPQRLLTPEDINELHRGLDLDELDEYLPDEYAGRPINLYDLADARYTIKEDRLTFPLDLLGVAVDFSRNYPLPEDMLRVTKPSLSSFYPASEEWVLRNLTTREFVRPTAVALHKKHIHGPFIDVLGYGEVILSKICWSTDDFTSMAGEGIYQGVWAGHSLDIVPSTHLESGGPWKDISDDIAQEIAEIWKNEYGEDWRNHITNDRVRCW